MAGESAVRGGLLRPRHPEASLPPAKNICPLRHLRLGQQFQQRVAQLADFERH